MKRTRLSLFALILIAPVLLFVGLTTAVFPHTAYAAPLVTVTTLNDSGAGSLRQAIVDVDAGGTITFSVSGTIVLGSELVVNKSVTIYGNMPITVSGNNATRVFNVTAGTVIFDSLTIANGNVTTNDCVLGGLLHNFVCGGGIMVQNNGTLTVNNSALSGNSALGGRGGGITNGGRLTVNNSTITANTAASSGGIYSYTDGGTCAAEPRTIIRNSTITANTATISNGGGIRNANGVTEISNSTITTNTAATVGGGVWSWNDGSTCTRVGGTIIAGNTGDDVAANSTTQRFFSLGHNLIGTAGANVSFDDEFNQTGDQDGITDPQLSPLADNGGPTLTHMPRIDSPAVDAGNCTSGPTTDQRGEYRPQDATCDIGAVEVQSGEDEIQVCGLVEGGVYHFGATGVQIEIDTLGGLNCLEVGITNALHISATGTITAGIQAPYVTITPTLNNANPYTVTMTLLHPGFSNPQVCKYPGSNGGYGWDCGRNGFDGNRVWRSGINGFSDWAVGSEVGPTAVTLNSLITTSGDAVLPWLALILLLFSLTGTAVWRAKRPA